MGELYKICGAMFLKTQFLEFRPVFVYCFASFHNGDRISVCHKIHFSPFIYKNIVFSRYTGIRQVQFNFAIVYRRLQFPLNLILKVSFTSVITNELKTIN